jgi:hypothetical protein
MQVVCVDSYTVGIRGRGTGDGTAFEDWTPGAVFAGGVGTCDRSRRGRRHFAWRAWNGGEIGMTVRKIRMDDSRLALAWLHRGYEIIRWRLQMQ